ncbi:ribonuclease E/G, partial [Rhizobium ruizarguesonis]
ALRFLAFGACLRRSFGVLITFAALFVTVLILVAGFACCRCRLLGIDFIDMEEKRNNRAVEKKLKECLKKDRARIQVGRIS